MAKSALCVIYSNGAISYSITEISNYVTEHPMHAEVETQGGLKLKIR